MKNLWLSCLFAGSVLCQACSGGGAAMEATTPDAPEIKNVDFTVSSSVTDDKDTASDSTKFTQKINLGDLRVEIPTDWVIKSQESSIINFVNFGKKNLVLLIKEKCEATYDQCMSDALENISLSSNNINFLSSKEVVIDDYKFTVLESSNDNIKIWSWITYYQNNIYMLSCGGFESDSDNKLLCEKIANSISF